MASVFTKIIQGEIPSETIYESEKVIAILDIAPCSYGHTLVIPKQEVDRWEKLSSEDSAILLQDTQRIAKAVSSAYGNTHYNLVLNDGANAGQEVPHVHFHIIPREAGSPSPFQRRLQYQEGEMKQAGDKIREQLHVL